MSKENTNIYDMTMNYHNFVHVQSELDVYPECCRDVSYHDFSDVECCKADDCIFKNSVDAGSQYFDQRFNSRHMGDAGSRADFLHTLDHALATYGEVNDSVLGHILQGDCGNDMQLRGCQSSHLARMGHDRPIQGLFRVDFTTFTHFNPLTDKIVCIVFVHNLGHQGQGKFCYLVGGGSLAVAELIPCDMIPTGEICISHSRVMSIVIFDIQSVYEKDFYESFDPKATYKDILKDEWSIKQYGMPYSDSSGQATFMQTTIIRALWSLFCHQPCHSANFSHLLAHSGHGQHLSQ